jgi:hypothetical protein
MDGSEGHNDEALIVKNFKIRILQGFVTAHFSFSDQGALLSEVEESSILSGYVEMATD